MTSRQHQDWLNRGKPDSGLALPLQLLANLLAAAGYTVYVYPNDAHLDAEPPEDHTYYSETGWPKPSPKWWRHAIDIMPPPANKPHLPSLQSLGQSIFNARQSGQITWLKYMNWPSDGNLNHAVQDRWESNHSRGSSSDTGHIHLSSITGVETLDDAFNPLTSVVVTGTTTPGIPAGATDEELPMFLAYQNGNNSNFYLCDGMRSRPITQGHLADLKTLINEGLVPAVARIDNPRGGWFEEAFGELRPAPAPSAPPIDQAVLQAAMTAALKAVGVSVSPAQIAAALVDPAVKAVLVQAAEDGANKAETE